MIGILARLVIALLLFALTTGHAGQTASKPRGPLSLSIEPVGIADVGSDVGFVVTVTSQIASDHLRISIHPPDDMQLLSGDLLWQGSIEKRGQKTLEFNGRFSSGHSSRISVTAVLSAENNGRFARRVSFQLGPATAPKRILPEKLIWRKYRRIVEIPLKP
jgi:hypothetical protein